MTTTKDIVADLYPLYVSNDCSADSRKLVEDYLRAHPADAKEFQRLAEELPSLAVPEGAPAEASSLKEARRRLKAQSWLLALAIFFTLVPFTFFVNGEKSWWFLREAPVSAGIYGALGLVFWAVYFRRQVANRAL